LFTPRPLGPLLDIGRTAVDEVGELIRSGAKPYELADALITELQVGPPTVLALEDLQAPAVRSQPQAE
jgi:hypothetical protein